MAGREIERRARQEGWTPKQLRAARGQVGGTVRRSGYGANTIALWAHGQTLGSASVMPSSSSDALKVKRASLTTQGTTECDDQPLLSGPTPAVTPRIVLPPHTACPEPASGGAHEYTLLGGGPHPQPLSHGERGARAVAFRHGAATVGRVPPLLAGEGAGG